MRRTARGQSFSQRRLDGRNHVFFLNNNLRFFGTEFISHSLRNKLYHAGTPTSIKIHIWFTQTIPNIQICNLCTVYICMHICVGMYIYIYTYISTPNYTSIFDSHVSVGESRGVSGFDPGRGTPSPCERGRSVLAWSDLLHSGRLKTWKRNSITDLFEMSTPGLWSPPGVYRCLKMTTAY